MLWPTLELFIIVVDSTIFCFYEIKILWSLRKGVRFQMPTLWGGYFSPFYFIEILIKIFINCLFMKILVLVTILKQSRPAGGALWSGHRPQSVFNLHLYKAIVL